MAGVFIAIEGGDGAGKDTQIERLKKDFSGDRFVYTRETGGTPLGAYLRRALFHEAAGKVSMPAEFFLILADRAQHVEEVVRPALEAGKVVISNRSFLSGWAYQIFGRNNPELSDLFKQCLDYAYAGCPLDLAVVLDVPVATGAERQRAAGKALDTMEREPAELHERVRQGFLSVAADMPQARIVDASRSIEEVYADVRAAVAAAIGI